jgi:hypothetical protein
VFVSTGNDSCFYIYDFPNDSVASNKARDACTKYRARECDVMAINSDFPALGISFKSTTTKVSAAHTDPDLFYYGPGTASGAILWIPGRDPLVGRVLPLIAAKSLTQKSVAPGLIA